MTDSGTHILVEIGTNEAYECIKICFFDRYPASALGDESGSESPAAAKHRNDIVGLLSCNLFHSKICQSLCMNLYLKVH